MRAIYRHHANGNEAIKNLVSALNVTEHTLHFVMRETLAAGVTPSKPSSPPARTPDGGAPIG